MDLFRQLGNRQTKDVAMLPKDVAMLIMRCGMRCGYVIKRCGYVRPYRAIP